MGDTGDTCGAGRQLYLPVEHRVLPDARCDTLRLELAATCRLRGCVGHWRSLFEKVRRHMPFCKGGGKSRTTTRAFDGNIPRYSLFTYT